MHKLERFGIRGMQNDIVKKQTHDYEQSITPLGCNLNEQLLFIVDMICGYDMALLRSLHLSPKQAVKP